MLIWLKKHLDRAKLKKNELVNKINNFKKVRIIEISIKKRVCFF